MRLLLDENFPNLPDFISALGNYPAKIVSLHEFDLHLTWGTGAKLSLAVLIV